MRAFLKPGSSCAGALLLIFLAGLLGPHSLARPRVSRHPQHPPPESQITKPLSVHFFTFGDWGSGNANQKAVADETKKVCAASRCDFGLTLGDNFYYWGVTSVDDPKWQTRYRDLYSDLKVPFFAVLGNHDWLGNAQAEIDFSKKDPYWKMPAPYYSLKAPESGPPLVEIFVLASDRFTPASVEWLKKAIDESKAPWKLLAFHHPLLDNGTKHASDSKKMRAILQPIICNKIDLILSGHEHIFSHLKDTNDTCGWDQVIAGTGGADLYGINSKQPPNLKVFYTEAHFGLAFFEVTPTEMTLHFYRAEGEESYHYTWKKQ